MKAKHVVCLNLKYTNFTIQAFVGQLEIDELCVTQACGSQMFVLRLVGKPLLRVTKP